MTVPPPDRLALAAEFPDISREHWQRLVAGVLNKTSAADLSGSAAEEALATLLEDGLIARPLYTADDVAGTDPSYPGSYPFIRGGAPAGNVVTGWDVRQYHAHPDPRRTNEEILTDLENGVTSIWLAVGSAGVPVADLGMALDGVYLDLAPVVLDAGSDVELAARELMRLYDERGVPAHDALGNLGADPLGQLARTGRGVELAWHTTVATDLATLCARGYPGLRALTVDALPYHRAGASPAEELGCSIATGVAYLRDLTAAGLSVDEACAQLEFRYAATADQFMTIVKFRAARWLWARVLRECGASRGAGGQRQHAVTSSVMMTRHDPWVNMLRATVACLAAGVGGAGAVTVLPFDDAIGLPDAFARRIARNTSSILMEESHVARVIDPGGGSWYVERLTDDLARAAWAWFQEIERAGGQASALESGMVADRLAATWSRRSADLAHRRESITGVSEFPDLAETPVYREPAPVGETGGLPRVRRDGAFESLRDRSDAYLAATGVRPRVFLAALGPASAHTARVMFMANLFQAGGIEPVCVPVLDVDAAAGAFADSGAALACLCSSDAVYAESAVPVTTALKAAGAAWVFLAGRQGDWEETLAQSGVDEFVYSGCDAVAVLSRALDRIGVA